MREEASSHLSCCSVSRKIISSLNEHLKEAFDEENLGGQLPCFNSSKINGLF
jgi:hypothetical protein